MNAMNTLINDPVKLRKTDAWVATILYVIYVLGILIFDNDRDDLIMPSIFRATTIYAAFMLLGLWVLPSIVANKKRWLHLIMYSVSFFLIAAVIDTTESYYPPIAKHPQHFNYVFHTSFLTAYWVILIITMYYVVRSGIIYLLNSRTEEKRYRLYVIDSLILCALWVVTLILLIVGAAEGEIILGWITYIPFAFLLYSYSFRYSIPKVLNKNIPFLRYYGRSTLALVICFLPAYLIGFLLTSDEEVGVVLVATGCVLQLLFVIPFSWFLFKRHIRGNEELYELKKELGRSNASLDLLRSQINPHFLFNALNTIYGTAIQENADRTADGVIRLSEMMRFMLTENVKEMIPITKEIEYLSNYIGIQQLRTDPHENIQVVVQLDTVPHHAQIAPMLLIPFVENAFKHGISFREPSFIRIALRSEGNALFFSVSNSKHAKQENDPERFSNGIGLHNVKQRLQLVYPNKHELLIRENPNEFFIHLTIQLS